MSSQRFTSSRVSAAAAALLLACVSTPTSAGRICKPALTVKDVKFSEARNELRKWTATLAVDSSHCVDSSGSFEIRFTRLKEFGPDLLFTERFSWSSPSVEVSLDFWWDEAVGDFWIGDVSPCGCVG
jgi:hypothetical protein